jgi:hypothetical protein
MDSVSRDTSGQNRVGENALLGEGPQTARRRTTLRLRSGRQKLRAGPPAGGNYNAPKTETAMSYTERDKSRRCRKRFSFSHDLTTIIRFNTRNDVIK